MIKYKDFVNEGINAKLKKAADLYMDGGVIDVGQMRSMSRNNIQDMIAYISDKYTSDSADDFIGDVEGQAGISVT